MADVRWLDQEEQLAWRNYVEGTTRLLEHLERILAAETGLTFDDYEILVFLSEAPEQRLRMSDLATDLISSRSRLTYRIDRMERMGLVARRSCPADGRVVWAELTKVGRRRLEEAAPVHVASVREHLLDRFDRTEFLALGRRMAELTDHLKGTCEQLVCPDA